MRLNSNQKPVKLKSIPIIPCNAVKLKPIWNNVVKLKSKGKNALKSKVNHTVKNVITQLEHTQWLLMKNIRMYYNGY